MLLVFIFLQFFLYGRSLTKKNLSLHKKLMAFAIAADVLLILFLVFNRNALGQLSPSMGLMLKVHVPIAISTVVGYGFAVYYGVQLSCGQKKYLGKMKITDRIVTPLRVLTFVTSVLLEVVGH